MALGADYATTDELKEEFHIDDAEDDAVLARSIAAASAWVTSHCGRDFNVADTASARVFRRSSPQSVWVDDISTVTGLIVATDEGDDGTYDTTWSSSDFELEPLNQVFNGITGFPYEHIRSVGTRLFPAGQRAAVQVTATWGWPAVPGAVKKATLILAARLYKRRDSAEGILGGGEFGAVRVGTRLDPDVQALLSTYRKMRPTLTD